MVNKTETGAERLSNRTHSEIIVLVACILGAIGIVPFTVYRFLIGDYALAMLETGICGITFGLFAYVWFTGKHKIPGAIICLLYLSAAIAVVSIKGASTIYWAYPATLGCFCIISARLAVVMCSVAIATLIPILQNQISNEHLLEILVTMVLLCIFGYIFNDSVQRQRKKLSTLAARDGLTGAWNRRTLDETLIQTTSSNNRNPLRASLVILDLDHFKKINDTYGHGAGDEILIKIADTIRESIRLSDRLFRYGGEEFVIIADGATLESAAVLAENIRRKIENSPIFDKEKITVSLGVAALKEGQSPSAWLKLADDALYEAKRTGRNKYCLAKEASYSPKTALMSA